MAQSAAEVPQLTPQRKAAIAHAAARDYTGSVRVEPMQPFDLDRTIFNTLEGAIPRVVMQSRIAKEPHWSGEAVRRIDGAYERVQKQLPDVDPLLMRFLQEECDFDVEHADGSFLDHLYFCYEYGTHHFPTQSALVLLLHSILGTGTNTFAMPASKMPTLAPLMSELEWSHVQAFPSVLRLLYGMEFRKELRANLHRIDLLDGVRFQRVIDNASLELGAKELWVQLNYQLIHLVDFLPVSNWSVHANDTAFIVFRDLYSLLAEAGKLEAQLDYTPPQQKRGALVDERLTLAGWLATWIPVPLSEVMAAKSVRRFSERIGHDISYELLWR